MGESSGASMEIKQRGLTLIEMVVYCAVSAVVVGMITSLYIVLNRTQQQTYASYLMGGRISSAIRVLRRDIQATALSTIQAYPDQAALSFASAYDEDGKFTLGDYGSPHWQKHVYYNLNSKGELIRWWAPITDKNYLPLPATSDPSAVSSNAKGLTEGLVAPKQAVKGLHDPTPFGGFDVNFVRRDEGVDSLSRVNPKDSKDFDTHTRLVEITMKTVEGSESEPIYSSLKFRVCPRY